MSLPSVTQTWDFQKINQRITFVSLNDTMSKFLFGIKSYLVTTMGYTVKYTCDGTTGPSSAGDHTDRWASAANCTTRGANAASAQSFAVLTDGNGVDILLTYQGASDDIMKMSFSNGALFTPAGTANQQPTATDESSVLSAASVIGATASADRVYSLQATTDKKMWRVFCYRQSILTMAMGVEQISSTVINSVTYAPTVVGFFTNQANVTQGGAVIQASGAAGQGVARINGINAICGGGAEVYGMSPSPFSAVNPELQAAQPLVPINFFSATTNVQGKVGNRLDCWYSPSNANNAQGDVLGTNQFVWIGTAWWPWDGVNTITIS